MKPLLNPLLFFIHSSLKRIRIRSAISFFVETQIDRVLQPCLVYLQQTDYLKHLCKVSVWKSEATEQRMVQVLLHLVLFQFLMFNR
ncbi:hypothetical protein P8452_17512 [Trifolium repens]|nr:hypothetical protein P8452_17512 [Trifolium repens]